MRDIAAAGRNSRAATSIRGWLDRFLPRGAILLSVLSFGAYGMGLVRDRIFARTFGAGSELDAYNAAFVVPELLFDVLIAGGLAAPFVPVFLKLRSEDADAADDFGRTILTLAVVVMAPVAAVLFVFAPLTVGFVASGFDQQQRELYTQLFRLMCLTPLIFTASIVLGEMLVAKRRFLFYGLAPLLYNGGIVAGTVVLGPRIGIGAAAIGAVFGALLHLAIRVIGVLRANFRIRPRLAVRTAAVREFGTLMIPRMAGAPVEPLTFQFFTNVASGFVAGSVSSVSFARNFESVPVSLVGVAFSLAAFPALSAAAAVGDRSRFLGVLRANVLTIAALTAAAAVVLFVLSTFVIDLLLGGGAFDVDDVHRTALLLSAFALAVPLESLTYPLARAIYATRNTLLPVLASIAGLGVTIVATQLLSPQVGLVAIPLAFAVGSGTKLALLAAALPFRLRRFPELAAEELRRSG
ncbi:MAG: murein biosynthesis integral membrane protein MurJ [Chloroflexota bacterium]